MSEETAIPGALTETEILSEPRCWKDCLQILERNDEIDPFLARSSSCKEWLFIGCGSSFYIALAAATSWTALTELPSRAVPASELLLYPELILNDSQSVQPVLISRSGNTSEVLKSARYLKSRGIRTLAISCSPNQKLEKLVTVTLCLALADEQSTVMTRSFTSMLIGLQFLAARRAGNSRFTQSLERLADESQPVLDLMSVRIQEFVEFHNFSDYVFLGQGPFYGLACEGALKVQEMSCSYSQNFHTLEFRHGPKSIVSPETLIAFFLSERGNDAEAELLEEIKSLGGTTLVICNQAGLKSQRAADFLIELKLEIEEIARLAAFILPCQLLGLYTGLKKGHDPDRPRNLSRVVVLND